MKKKRILIASIIFILIICIAVSYPHLDVYKRQLWSLRIHSNYPLSAFVSIIRLGNTRMIVDERLVTYINSVDIGNTPVLDEIEKEALRDVVPISRKEMQSFLKLLLAMQKPMRILEVGTAVGFSAVLMAEYAPVSYTHLDVYKRQICMSLGIIL